MDNSRVPLVWSGLLSSVFSRTYSGVLTLDELQERIGYIVENRSSIPPLSLFRALVYSDTTNEIGRLAVDYRVQFIGPNYRTVIDSGVSRELESTDFPQADLVKKEIVDLCIGMNYYVNDRIMSDTGIDFADEFARLSSVMETRLRGVRERSLDLHPDVVSLLTPNQLIYEIVFEKSQIERRPHRSPITETVYAGKVAVFRTLKRLYPDGIDQRLVRDPDFFG